MLLMPLIVNLSDMKFTKDESSFRQSRRDFLKSLVLAGVSVSGFSLLGCEGTSHHGTMMPQMEADKSTVVIVRSDKLSRPDRVMIKKMLDLAVPQALGVASADAAWRELFKPNDTVGIKVNCISPIVASHPQLAYAIADSLIAVDIPADQIIIWDREDREMASARYAINFDGTGIRCYGTKPRAGYGKELIITGSVGSRFSNIISRQCTATVNVPVLKDHNVAGLSLSLKNYFGAIENPNKFHGNNCDPYVADLYMSPLIREKSKLVICDAITALYEGGPTDCRPSYMWNCNALIIGTDPVAVDQIGLMLLEEKRVSAGFPLFSAAGRHPKYIATAADSDHRLGVNDPEKIRVIELTEGL